MSDPQPDCLVALRLTPQVAPLWLDADEDVMCYFPHIRLTETCGNPLATIDVDGETYTAACQGDSGVVLNFNVRETIETAQHESYLPPRRPQHVRVPFPRHCLPGRVRLAGHRLAAAMASRSGGEPRFPSWPIEKSVETLRHLAVLAGEHLPLPPWPNGKRFALCFSHDVDTARGFAAIQRTARVEERFGITSCWFIAYGAYPIDFSLLRGLRDAGHEIGLHGVAHDDRLAYLPRPKIEEAIDGCEPFIQRCSVRGFRAPSLLTTPALEEALARRFLYDSSVPDTDIRTVIGPRRGCCTVFPFFKNGIVEIPLTLPLEDKLMILGYTPTKILEFWSRKLSWIQRVGGVGMVSTHVEPHLSASPQMMRVYEALLEKWTANEAAWIVTPCQLATWWQENVGTQQT